MVCWVLLPLLLLLTLSSSVCGKPCNLALNYQAVENNNITVEWPFSSNTDLSVSSVKIHCVFLFAKQLKVVFNRDKSRAPRAEESQHKQFAGRVHVDEDALRAGLVRLHLSSVRTDDSGLYLCRMATECGKKVEQFSLNVTAASVEPKYETQSPQPARRRSFGLGLAAAAVVILVACVLNLS